jgi:DNA-directed RNA polymerase specialized sigma24 family protein
MSVNDGFGDDPVQQELAIEEYIREREGLLRLKASERTRGNKSSNDTWDDILQEGRIVEWQVKTKRPDAPPSYVSAAMSNRIGEVISRGTWTGLERTHGKPVDPIRRPLHTRSSVDDPDVDVVVSSGDWADRIAMAYHHGEIIRALNEELTFTQRLYVYERFWEGRTNVEIAARRGLSTGEIERQWRVNIRPSLLAQLGYLAAP